MHRALQTAQYKHLGPIFRICLEFTLSFNPDYMNLNAMILKTWTFLISPLLSSIAILQSSFIVYRYIAECENRLTDNSFRSILREEGFLAFALAVT